MGHSFDCTAVAANYSGPNRTQKMQIGKDKKQRKILSSFSLKPHTGSYFIPVGLSNGWIPCISQGNNGKSSAVIVVTKYENILSGLDNRGIMFKPSLARV